MPREAFAFDRFAHSQDFVLKKPRAKIITLGEILPGFLDKLERGEPPVVWPVDSQPWGTFAFRPGHITVIGAPSNVGKTAFAVDMGLRAMVMTPGLKVMIASVEENIYEGLLSRVIAGQTQIPFAHVLGRNRHEIADADIRSRIESQLETFNSRLLLAERPFTLDAVIQSAEDFRPDIVVLDHLQDLRLADFDGDLLERMRRVMAMARSLADKGACVFAISQLSREGTKLVEGMGGRRTFASSDLGVFQGGSPIECGMDDGYLLLNDGGRRRVSLADEDGDAPLPMWLQHLKSRSGITKLVPLWFEGKYQRFTLRELAGPAQAGPAAVAPGRVSTRQQTSDRSSTSPAPVAAEECPPEKGPQDDHWIT